MKKASIAKPEFDKARVMSFATGVKEQDPRYRTQVSRKSAPQGATTVSGLVPEGDVRLTANIRQDLHLKLKIEAAHRRTTIGQLLEELVDKHL